MVALREITLEMEVAARKHTGSRTNLTLLWKVIRQNNLSEYKLARMTGISRSTLFRKLRGIGEFTMEEIHRLSFVLQLKPEEGEEIFINGYKNDSLS